MIWAPHKECVDREELRSLQLERLRKTVTRVYNRVPFYRERFAAAGRVKPAGQAF